MGEFFKDWRRKAGCCLLAVACILLAMEATFNPEPWAVHWEHSDPVSHERIGIVSTSQLSVGVVTVPNWAVALPLTFLAAYLILWKPRKKIPPHFAVEDATGAKIL